MNVLRQAPNDAFLNDCARIHREWHERVKGLDAEGAAHAQRRQ
jgi:hypothetical protein